MAPKIFQGC